MYINRLDVTKGYIYLELGNRSERLGYDERCKQNL